MRRRDTGRDVWLTLRMVVVCVVLAAAYGALAAARLGRVARELGELEDDGS